MSLLQQATETVLSGGAVTQQEAVALFQEEFAQLCHSANKIRAHFCGNTFDLCTIINAKSGRCSEDCKFCAQSVQHQTSCETYPLLPSQQVVAEAERQWQVGVHRFSLVTSGRSISQEETKAVGKMAQEISATTPIALCGSFGLLKQSQYETLYQSGIRRIHNNLETSPAFFPSMCSTHTFQDKVNAIQTAQRCGMIVCSGGIFGMGEGVEDWVSLAFSLKGLGIQSVPMNLLYPVEGTPYGNRSPLSPETFCRIVAVYRFLLPTAFLRLAGGRGLLGDQGRQCFQSGANATITGDMLTTAGISVAKDIAMLEELGFDVNPVQ